MASAKSRVGSKVLCTSGNSFDLAAGDAYHGDANAVAIRGRRRICTGVVLTTAFTAADQSPKASRNDLV